MITSLLLGNKKNLLIGGAVVIGLIALASASSGNESKPALNGTNKPKASKSKPTSQGRKKATIKV
ncbi:hypothetical protein [Saccharicrinis sp. GN24d3]|uniref:hypothetical protein n=1 Tax=Saccharicrinis sp. GN24d3 TaxID=3458416 RepID=UPI0040358E79